MTGAICRYERAEDLLEAADEQRATITGDVYDARIAAVQASMSTAQVHATLALTAATALGLDATPGEFEAWQKVCGVKKP